MTNMFASGPYLGGVKPKVYFAEVKNLNLQRLYASPEKIKAKFLDFKPTKDKPNQNPYTAEFILMTPWIIAGVALVGLIIF